MMLEIDFHFMCLFICFIFPHQENKKIDNLKENLLLWISSLEWK